MEEKDKKDTMPAFTKVPGYKQLQKIINPYSGFDFDKMKADLMKLREASDEAKFNATLDELRQQWYENEYKKLCLQEKMDLCDDAFIQLFHANIDKTMTKDFPPAAISLYQSMMKDQNERARLAIEFMRLQLARDMFDKQQSVKGVRHGVIDLTVEDEGTDVSDAAG